MKYNPLGNSDIKVSEICLGSMTWGTQNSESEGHSQMDLACEQGVNFIDTAEMYPVNPISAQTQGRSEEIIGSWFKSSGKRDQIIIATKVTGEGINWIQDGIPISAKKIRLSVEASLKRLQTDWIDLYQLHWPNRSSYHFRQGWQFDPGNQDREETRAHIHETLEALDQLVKSGKIRQVGLSNESCWGTSQFLQIAEANSFPRMVSIQNEYSLMYRSHDLDLAELSHNEKVGLLPFSPLACGLLSGKYQDGNKPAGSRITLNPDLNGRISEYSNPAVDAYVEIALKHDLEPSQMAIAFCNQRPFVCSTIIGATTIAQLSNNIESTNVNLNADVLEDIQQVYRRYPIPF
jgi:aryl-alcohol dehydrogenase-like predicted oxidoreductase